MMPPDEKNRGLKLAAAKRGLKAQIVWSFTLTVIVILNVAGWFFYSRTRDYFDSELGKTLVALAQSGSDLIDADLLEFLRPGSERGEFYKELQFNLEIFKKEFTVNRLFVVDKSLRTLLDTDADSPIGLIPPHVETNLLEVKTAINGQAVYSTLYRGYDGHLYKSAYAPVVNKQGKVVAAVCVDASPTFLQVIDRLENLLITLNVVSIVLVTMISLVLARSILKPVHLLVDAARRVSRGDFSQPVKIVSKNEIGFLARVFNAMQENIKVKEERLNELKRLAEGKAESIQAYNNYILRSIAHGILTLDLKGTVTIINPAAERILRMSHNQATGNMYSQVFSEAHPFYTFIERMLQSTPHAASEEIEIALPDSSRILSVEVSPLVDSKQKTIGINLVITDLTEIRKLQNEIREKERLAYLGELSATVAHEVRNPLNSMELFVGLLKRHINDKREREDTMTKIQHEIRSLNAVITDFLVFARPIELKVQNVPIAKLFQEVAFLAWKELQEKNIDVRVNINGDKLGTRGDFDQLKRALLNVVLNAVQAMEASGTLTLAARATNGQTSKEHVQIEISDTGCGIASTDYEKIFQPFFSTRSQGTGLGLAIVKNIINAHHGTIIVKKHQPKGTTFIFHL